MKPSPITSLPDTRLLRDMADLAAAEKRVAALREKVRAGCAAYSERNGFRVVLRPEQVRAEIARRGVE